MNSADAGTSKAEAESDPSDDDDQIFAADVQPQNLRQQKPLRRGYSDGWLFKIKNR